LFWRPARCVIVSANADIAEWMSGYRGGILSVRYSYRVDRAEFESSTLHSLNVVAVGDEAFVSKALALYKATSTNTCYYNPKRPTEAVLLRDLEVAYVFRTIRLHWSFNQRWKESFVVLGSLAVAFELFCVIGLHANRKADC
jgi:hypothetical protein